MSWSDTYSDRDLSAYLKPPQKDVDKVETQDDTIGELGQINQK